jgi:hypothetical protein
VKRIALLLALAGGFALAGCKNETYCFNCNNEDGSTADLARLDLLPPSDLRPEPDLKPPVDLARGPDGGPCVPTNGGVEKCDHLDNDCNGVTDDVDPSKLKNDPENCGACFNACDYTAQHEVGVCTNAVCSPGSCLPGWVHLTGQTGCTYQCTPSVPPTEVCDGRDNDCNGVTDDGFGYPTYTTDPNNCGACGNVCNLPGAVSACAANASTGNGQCVVDHCINDLTNTYRHLSGGSGPNTTGCEYHCPFPSSTSTPGSDCDQMSCVFPAEVCNGVDDDCDGTVDDNLTDSKDSFGGPTIPCGSACPGGMAGNCVGACKAGSFACVTGVKVCQGSVGPSPEYCNNIDDDCNGVTDDNPQDSWIGQACCPTGKTSDCQNTGTGSRCSPGAYQCAAGGAKACSGGTAKSPETCNSVDDDCNGLTDDVPGIGTTCSGLTVNTRGTCTAHYTCTGTFNAGGPLGLTCSQNQGPVQETCNGLDDDCDGVTDDNMGAPQNVGVSCGLNCPGGTPAGCQGACMVGKTSCTNATIVCNGSSGPTQEVCNGIDDDCNGITDDVPGLGTACTGTGVTTVGACTAAWSCNGGTPGTGPNQLTCVQKQGPVPETCNGIDDDCNGKTDDGSLPGVGVSCGQNCPGGDPLKCVGACQVGKTACTSGVIVCNGSTGPSSEVCNNIDDDCDGVTDDNLTDSWLNMTCCPTGNLSDCANTGSGNRCSTGTFKCVTGARTCSGATVKSAEVCDGVDNDCNGITDTDTVGYGALCTGSGVKTLGTCTATYNCANGSAGTGPNQLTCSQKQGPVQETCNGLDDDCDGVTDNNMGTAQGIGIACGQNCPGGDPLKCVGACQAGKTACPAGVIVCSGSLGPKPETCNNVDDDCNGFIDDPFTQAAPNGYADGNAGQQPLYNLSPSNCGGCGTVCNLANATNACHSASAGAAGTCYVASCNTGYNYVPSTPCGTSPPENGQPCPSGQTCQANGTCSGPPSGVPCGVGCNYKCQFAPTQTTPEPEICDGYDNDCNGATDELKTTCYTQGLVAPSLSCANQGVCSGKTIPVACMAANGWKCNYSGIVPADDLTNGNLNATEMECDGADNNCNGVTDLDGFPNLGQSCAAGLGACQNTGKMVCNGAHSATVCSVTAGTATKAVDELCNGIDDNCDGQTDERNPQIPPGQTSIPTCYNGASHTCLGYTDPMVNTGSVYVYQYEASRPGASSSSAGTNTSRACSTSGVLPWSNVTEAQAAAACAAIKDSTGAAMRLCTAAEWTNACEGGTSATQKWSESGSSPTTYTAQICNDVNEASTPAVWATASNGAASGASGPYCYSDWGTAGKLHDMSGNLEEWTSTTVTSGSTTYYKIRGGSYTSPSGGTTCEFDFDIAKPGFASSELGFRCCSNNTP